MKNVYLFAYDKVSEGHKLRVIGEGLTFDDVLIVPKRSDISSRKNTDLTTNITRNISLKIPIVTAAMDTVTESDMAILLAREGGLGVIHRFLNIDEQALEVEKVKAAHTSENAALDREGKLIVSAAIGLKETRERAEALVRAGCDVLCMDVAHGHHENVISAIRELKREFDVDIIAGNIATPEGAEDLISAGADCIKVGIGPGSVCTTRIVTGVGVPQLTAIEWTADICKQQRVGLIADGGMRSSGDLAKALVAGADAGMFGGLFSGTDEAPSQTVIKDGKKYKVCRGMASHGAMERSAKLNGNGKVAYMAAPEGAEITVHYMGSASHVARNLANGLRSTLSYCNARNIQELRINAVLLKVSASTNKENAPHNDFLV